MNTFDITTGCSILLCTIWPAIHNYTEEFAVVLIHVRDQYIKQSFNAIIVLPDDWPVKLETYRVVGVCKIVVYLKTGVCICWLKL
jgi:hypothetical protein